MNKTFCDECNVERMFSGSEYVAPHTWFTITLKDNSRDNRPVTTKSLCSIRCCNLFFDSIKDEQSITSTGEYYNTKGKYYPNEINTIKVKPVVKKIATNEEEIILELKIGKVKSGNKRLDDLTLGGIPIGNNILIYGPPFTGKEVLINSFIAEGLRKGIPAIWILTDRTPSEIKEEMRFVDQNYDKYVDVYSRSIGLDDIEHHVIYIDEPTNFKAIQKAVDDISKEFMKEHKYYRVGFRSISTLIAYLDSASAFKFLQPFFGRRKRDNAVTMISIEKGMHDDQDIQMIGSIADGMVDFKLESLKTYLSVKGLGDVQSRAWIDYCYSKKHLIIGSFSLDHLRGD